MSNLEKYNQAFIECFKVTEDMLESLKYRDIPSWDSVGHMDLIVALEDNFDIEFESTDIVDLSSYVKGKEILKKYNIEF